MSFVENLLSTHLILFWEKVAPLIESYRVREGRPTTWEWIEYLYRELIEYEKNLERNPASATS